MSVEFENFETAKGRLTVNGQVTIKENIREAMGIEPRDAVKFIHDGEKTVVVPVEDYENDV